MTCHPVVSLFAQSVCTIQPGYSPESPSEAIQKLPTEELWLIAALAHGYYTTAKISREALIYGVAQHTGLPRFLIKMSCQEAGDYAEALALLLGPIERPDSGFPPDLTLWVTKELSFHLHSEERLTRYLSRTWPKLSIRETVFLHKLLLHTLHAPTPARLLLGALAGRLGLELGLLASQLRLSPQCPPAQPLFLF